MAPKKRAPRRAKGAGTVYPIRRKGIVTGYYAELEIDGRTERRRADTEQAAEARLAELHDLKKRGIKVGDGGQLFKDWIVTWYTFVLELGELSSGTLDTYLRMIENYLVPKLGHMRLLDIQQEDVQGFVTRLRTEIRDYYARKVAERVAAGKPPGKAHDGIATTLRCAVILKMAFDLAVDRKLIPESPYRRIKLPKVKTRTPPAPTVPQVARFLLDVRGHRWEPLWYIYSLLGFRLGEAIGLRWQDYDPAARTFSVEQQIVRRDRHADTPQRLEVDDPKNDTSARLVAVPAVICDLLDTYKVQQMALRIRRADTWQDNDLIFCSRDGRPLWPRDVQEVWRELWSGAGLPAENTLHHLRRSVATMLDEADVTETQKAAILGHKKVTQTQHYVDARVEAMARVLERVAARVLGEMKRLQERVG
jgi:integrase